MSKNTTNGNYIVFDLDTFKKTSKRLQHIFFYSTEDENIRNNRTFPISEFHEMLSKSLGFRNYDAIQKYFHKEGSLPAARTGAFFEDWSAKEMIELFSFLIENSPSEESKAWKGQALSLIYTMAITLKHLQEQQIILLDSNMFAECTKLEYMISLYKNRHQHGYNFPNSVLSALRSYLMSIPGYEQGETEQKPEVLDYHNYIYFKLLPIIEKVADIEKYNPIIINPRWYHAIYSQNPSNKLNEESKDYFTIRLQENTIENIAASFHHLHWNNLFLPDSIKSGENISFTNKDNINIRFYGIELITPIETDSSTEDTWLKDKLFQEVLLSFVRNKQFKTYYLSDLLLYSFRIMNQQKRNVFMNFLSNIIKNYSSITEYSRRLELLAK